MNTAPITPLEVPPEAGRVIFFGGTFDPPHRAHVELSLAARTLIEQRDTSGGGTVGGESWLVFVPAARSPHKRCGPEAADADRLEMLRIALRDAGVEEGRAGRIAIWTDEIDRARWAAEQAAAEGRAGPDVPSYMVDTLRRAKTALGRGAGPGRSQPGLAVLIGADQALVFHRWASYADILGMADVFVMPRDGVETGADLVDRLRGLGVWSPQGLDRWKRAVLPLPVVDVAATPVREVLRRREGGRAELEQALGPGVLRIIRQRGLYRDEAQ